MNNPLKKFIFNRLIKRGYIRKEDLMEYLSFVKEKERQRTTEELYKKFEEDKNRIKEEHFLEIEEKNAEIKHLGIILEDMKQRVKDAEKVYISSMKRTRENLRLSADIGYQSKKLAESSASIFVAFQNIHNQAEENKREAVAYEEIDRKLLHLDGR